MSLSLTNLRISRSWKSRWAVNLAAVVLVIGCLLHSFGLLSHRTWLAYWCMHGDKFHPVWVDLATRHFRRGSALSKITAVYKPKSVETVGEFSLLHFEDGGYSGLTIVGRRGRLVRASARSCTWSHEFVSLTREDEAEFAGACRLLRRKRSDEIAKASLNRSLERGEAVFRARIVKMTPDRVSIRIHEVFSGSLRVGQVLEIPEEYSSYIYSDAEPGEMYYFQRRVFEGDGLAEAGCYLIPARVAKLRLAERGS